MGRITELYNKASNFLVKEVRVFNAAETANLANAPLQPDWNWLSTFGVPRKTNTFELRQYAKSTWVQMIKRSIKNNIMTTEWDVVNADDEIKDEDKDKFKDDIIKVKKILKYPNRNKDTFAKLWGMYLDDVLDLDSGVIWKGRNLFGEVTELFAYDGSRFFKKIDEKGIVEKYYQFSFRFPRGQPQPFDVNDIIYGSIGYNTDQFPYGWSPLQSIQQIVELMIQSDRWNKEFYQNNAVPEGMMNIPMDEQALDRFKTYWETEIKGQPHKLPFINSADAKFVPMGMSNRDMEWLEGQKWYFHLIFAAYGLSPAEAGFYDDVNRSSQEGQERVSVRNAIRPYLTLIEEQINREIIPEIVGHDEIEFKWYPKDDQAEKLQHEQMMAKLSQNVITINEVRAKEGLDPVEWGDQPMMMAMQDRVVEMGGEEEKPSGNKEDNKPKKEEAKGEDKTSKLYRKLFTSFMKNG